MKQKVVYYLYYWVWRESLQRKCTN